MAAWDSSVGVYGGLFSGTEGKTTVEDEPKSFIEHLAELRMRIIISASATVAGTATSFILRNRLFDADRGLLTLPLRLRTSDIMAVFFGVISRAGIGSSISNLFQLFFRSRTSQAQTISLIATAPTEKFMVMFKAAFFVGILLASPIILYQVWSFILPALKHRERHYLIPLFFITLLFFSTGALFAFFVVIPVAIPVLAGFLSSIENLWRLEKYFSFVVGLMLAFGLAFELPIVMGFVARIGIFSAENFKKQRKIAVVLIFIASAAFTPQDPFTMLLMAIPLMGLYELGIRFAIMVGEQQARVLSG